MEELEVKYFEGLYREPDRMSLDETLTVISFFPWMVNEEHNEDLFRLVDKKELLEVM